MNFLITLDWDPAVGIPLKKMYPFRDGLQRCFEGKDYGRAVKTMAINLVCREESFSQKKRFHAFESRLEFDMIFDFDVLKQMEPDLRKVFIRETMIPISRDAFTGYKFEGWNTAGFLEDFAEAVRTVEWP